MLHIQNKIQHNSHVCDTTVYEFVETAHELLFSRTYRYIHLKMLRNTCPPSRQLERNSCQMNSSNIYATVLTPFIVQRHFFWEDCYWTWWHTLVGWLQLYWEVSGKVRLFQGTVISMFVISIFRDLPFQYHCFELSGPIPTHHLVGDSTFPTFCQLHRCLSAISTHVDCFPSAHGVIHSVM
jgi:hypothetical protein